MFSGRRTITNPDRLAALGLWLSRPDDARVTQID
jgi:hypothetical protein